MQSGRLLHAVRVAAAISVGSASQSTRIGYCVLLVFEAGLKRPLKNHFAFRV